MHRVPGALPRGLLEAGLPYVFDTGLALAGSWLLQAPRRLRLCSWCVVGGYTFGMLLYSGGVDWAASNGKALCFLVLGSAGADMDGARPTIRGWMRWDDTLSRHSDRSHGSTGGKLPVARTRVICGLHAPSCEVPTIVLQWFSLQWLNP